MNVREKFLEILEGWRLESNMKPEELAIAKERLAICLICPQKKTFIVERCGLCNCPLSKKSKSMRSKCPDVPSRWGEELENDEEL